MGSGAFGSVDKQKKTVSYNTEEYEKIFMIENWLQKRDYCLDRGLIVQIYFFPISIKCNNILQLEAPLCYLCGTFSCEEDFSAGIANLDQKIDLPQANGPRRPKDMVQCAGCREFYHSYCLKKGTEFTADALAKFVSGEKDFQCPKCNPCKGCQEIFYHENEGDQYVEPYILRPILICCSCNS
jgi:hypothetical protein